MTEGKPDWVRVGSGFVQDFVGVRSGLGQSWVRIGSGWVRVGSGLSQG